MYRILIILFFNFLLVACGDQDSSSNTAIGVDTKDEAVMSGGLHIKVDNPTLSAKVPTVGIVDEVTPINSNSSFGASSVDQANIETSISKKIVSDLTTESDKKAKIDSELNHATEYLSDYTIKAWDRNYKSVDLHNKDFPYHLKLDKSLTQLEVENAPDYKDGQYINIFKPSVEFFDIKNKSSESILAFIGTIKGTATITKDSDGQKSHLRYILGFKQPELKKYTFFEQYSSSHMVSAASNENIFYKNQLDVDFNNVNFKCKLQLKSSDKTYFCDNKIIFDNEKNHPIRFQSKIGTLTKTYEMKDYYGDLDGFIVYGENTSYILGVVIPTNKAYGIDYFILESKNNSADTDYYLIEN